MTLTSVPVALMYNITFVSDLYTNALIKYIWQKHILLMALYKMPSDLKFVFITDVINSTSTSKVNAKV